MKAKPRNPGPSSDWDRETLLVAQIAAAVSLSSFLFYLRHGDLLLYNDSVGHINIARRVFDSLTPGLLQLGTVWLPLQHLLMIPFIWSQKAWQTGAGGSVPSLIAYVLGAVGIFRLVRSGLGDENPTPAQPPAGACDIRVRIAAWMAAIIYAANPNLIYLQTTAMTESLYLALFIWAAVYLLEFAQRYEVDESAASSSLTKCGWSLMAACLTRYDGWFLALGTCAAVIGLVLTRKPSAKRSTKKTKRLAVTGASSPSRQLFKFLLLAAAAPIFWLAYNAMIYRNPLEFVNGPYSAQAIEQRSSAEGHPGAHSVHTAFSYFLKAAELNVSGEASLQKVWIALASVGAGLALGLRRRLWILLLFGAPLIFYTWSVAYGGLPIYLPMWWPHTFYNTRYGLELLPAFSVFVALTSYVLMTVLRAKWTKAVAVFMVVVFIGASYGLIWREQGIGFREAWANSRARIAFEGELAANLIKLPADSTLVMDLRDYVGAVQRAGIPLRRVIHEGNHRVWKQPQDADGLWERALADPAKYADYAVAFAGDPVDEALKRKPLSPLVVIHSSAQLTATIYWTRRVHGNQ